MMERFISGAKVRDRFQWLPFELMAAMKSGELVPIDPEGEEQVRLTEEINPCLYCNGKRNPNECGRGRVTCTSFSLGTFATPSQIISQSRCCLRRDTKTTQTQELDAAIFFFSEVLAYEQAHGLTPATPTPTTTTEPGHDQQVEAVPHFATALDLVAYYRGREVDGRKIHELHELARLVDEEFTGKARLTDEELGMLLPAKGKEAESPEGCRSQGKRLRSLYKKSQ